MWQGGCYVVCGMQKPSISLVTALTCFINVQVGRAGDAAGERKQFKESTAYPFVFRPDCYLPATGPVPMRFAKNPPLCAQRSAPPLLGAAKGGLKPEQAPPAKPVLEAALPNPQSGVKPTFPPPENAPAAPPETTNFAKVPDEVLDFFKNTEGRPVRRNYLFDPIFQPAVPNDLPKSKATYREK